jgi:ATP-dependent DNA helicase RecG
VIAEQRVESLKGVGPSLKGKLERLGIFRVGDLLLHLPIRYQDRSRVVPLRDVHPQQECLVQGQVVDSSLGYGRRRSWLVTIDDGTGYLGLRFFHFSKRQQSGLQPGTYVRCFGEIRFGPRGGGSGLEMAHPEYRAFTSEPPDPDPELTPVYPTTKGLGQNRLRGLIDQALSFEWPSASGAPYQTLAYLHRPPADAPAADIERAQERVALDELTAYYLVMKQRQRDRARSRALPLPQSTQLGRELLRGLGFRLTNAQRRVITEVLEDLSSETPMLRLLQGDVGSGKTVVAAFAAIRAAEHGRQTALMAPTEILAEQHYVNFSAWLEPLGIPVVLLTGSQSARERAARQQALEEGDALVAVGTHALFQDKVSFNALALTIVDEQHRFGVHQRMALRGKGVAPHQLVMTATPIPRTLTMALYADMDVSVLDELPPGRTPIDTRVISDARKEEVIRSAADAMARGEQVYWVCPLIEDSELLDAAAAEPTAELLAEQLEPPIGLLHGRMTGEQKAKAMMDFKDGRTRLLVATTVIEVGVDVPNATLMVIENPERMGLAQLHQLRGRVGRGEKASRCLLVYKTPLSAAARQRLSVMRESQDGFHIAEKDLELRGPGELLGARQTGEQQFRVADLARHSHLIPEVLARGERLLQTDPTTARELLNAWAPEDNGHIAV